MDGSKYRSKSYGMTGAGKRLPCVLLLAVLLGAALLSVIVIHKVREQRAIAVLLRERDRQVVSLRILLQKEKAFNKETKRKVEEMKATINSLRNKKTDLKTKHKGLEATAINLKNTQKELEASLKEKDRHMNQMEEKATNLTNTKKELEASLKERDSRIKQMEEKATNLQKTQKQLEASLKEKDSRISVMEEKAAAGSNPDQMAALMEILQRKEAELEEIKTRFQDYRTTDRKVVSSKSIPAQMSSANATPDTAVAEKVVNSSNTTISATSEEKRSGNTTGTESKHKKQKARSLEENQVKFTSKTDHDDLEDKTGDAVLDIEDIYGGNHSKKSEFPRRNKKFLIQGEELDGIGKSGHSQDQGSHEKSVRYNKPLEMVNNKTDETKMKNSTDGHFEKISKDSLSAHLNRPKQAVQELADATDVKLKMSVNDDGTQQQNKRQKKKKSRSKKKQMIDTASTNGDGEVTKVSAVENTSTPESVSELKKVTALQ